MLGIVGPPSLPGGPPGETLEICPSFTTPPASLVDQHHTGVHKNSVGSPTIGEPGGGRPPDQSRGGGRVVGVDGVFFCSSTSWNCRHTYVYTGLAGIRRAPFPYAPPGRRPLRPPRRTGGRSGRPNRETPQQIVLWGPTGPVCRCTVVLSDVTHRARCL